jgi:hypothetical protein
MIRGFLFSGTGGGGLGPARAGSSAVKFGVTVEEDEGVGRGVDNGVLVAGDAIPDVFESAGVVRPGEGIVCRDEEYSIRGETDTVRAMTRCLVDVADSRWQTAREIIVDDGEERWRVWCVV